MCFLSKAPSCLKAAVSHPGYLWRLTWVMGRGAWEGCGNIWKTIGWVPLLAHFCAQPQMKLLLLQRPQPVWGTSMFLFQSRFPLFCTAAYLCVRCILNAGSYIEGMTIRWCRWSVQKDHVCVKTEPEQTHTITRKMSDLSKRSHFYPLHAAATGIKAANFPSAQDKGACLIRLQGLHAQSDPWRCWKAGTREMLQQSS